MNTCPVVVRRRFWFFTTTTVQHTWGKWNLYGTLHTEGSKIPLYWRQCEHCGLAEYHEGTP